MKLLILGGTAWLGHEIARTAVQAGDDVTCLARGSAVPSGVTLVRADRNEDDALSTVSDTQWDAVIDVASDPGHVARAVRDLQPVAQRYVYVSTCNVYASQAEFGADEDADLLEPLVGEYTGSPQDYGQAKVACENAVLDDFGPERSAILRAGLFGGPGDRSGRSTYWPMRFAHPSSPNAKALVPDLPKLPTSIIDVRDLAAWSVKLARGGPAGIFNAVGDSVPFAEHIAAVRGVAGHDGPIVSVSQDFLLEHDVAQWAGPRSIPLWLADPSWHGMNTRSNARAKSAGLQLRPVAQTLRDGLQWSVDEGRPTADGSGLTDEEECELSNSAAAERTR